MSLNDVIDHTPTVTTNIGSSTWGDTTTYTTYATSGTQESLNEIKEENEDLKDTIKTLEKRLHSLEENVRFLMEI